MYGSKIKVKISCPIHGCFEITPNHHLNGKGCRFCGINRRIKIQEDTFESFVKKANNIHGDYSYIPPYLGNKIKIKIVCNTHGVFEMRPNNHLSGQGCPRCGFLLKGWDHSLWDKAGKSSSNFESFKVYIICCYDNDEVFIKVGKTFNTILRRFPSFNEMPYTFNTIKTIVFDDGVSCSKFEVYLHKKLIDYKYKPKTFFQGTSECFSLNCIIMLKELIDGYS